MDHYADDVAALTADLDLQNAIHVGHSTSGEVVRYLARHGESWVAKAATGGSEWPPDGNEWPKLSPGPRLLRRLRT
jgi:pimeloyl-ACP methyl ester carboxylesterase